MLSQNKIMSVMTKLYTELKMGLYLTYLSMIFLNDFQLPIPCDVRIKFLYNFR